MVTGISFFDILSKTTILKFIGYGLALESFDNDSAFFAKLASFGIPKNSDEAKKIFDNYISLS